MKKLMCLLLAVLMAASLAACTTRQDILAANAQVITDQIEALGEITLQSRVAIEKAERAYNALDLKTKELVPNWYDIIQAKAAYQQLRIERIEGKVQAAQEEFDATWNTWNLFYTLRDIIKDCHPDEEYIVKDAIAKNEELCFDGTHFVNFDNLLFSDERIHLDEVNDVIVYNTEGVICYCYWSRLYEPYTVREDGQTCYVLYFGADGAYNAWGVATETLNKHLGMYQEKEVVITDWGPGSKRGAETIVYEDDLGNQLCYTSWRTGVHFYLEIFIKPVQPAEAAEPAAPAET